MKRVLSFILCAVMILSFTAFADEPTAATVALVMADTDVIVGDTGVSFDIEIDGLTSNLKNAVVTIEIDSAEITVDGIVALPDTQYKYEISTNSETPSAEKFVIPVSLNVTDEAIAEAKTVTVKLVSAVLTDDGEPAAEIANTLGGDLGISLRNAEPSAPAVAQLTLDFALSSLDGISAEFAGDSVVPAVLALSEDGKVITVSTESPLASGTYSLTITAEGFIVPVINNIVIDEQNTAPSFDEKLVAGDVTGDGDVELIDFHNLCLAISAKSPSQKYDLNRDGKVDGKDVKILVNAWTKLF